MSEPVTCEQCNGRVEVWYTSSGPVDVGACANCGASSVTGHASSASMDNYGDTGLSLTQIDKLPAHEGDALLMRKLYEVKRQIHNLETIEAQLDSLLRERVKARNGDRTSDGVYEYRIRETTTKWGFELEQIAELQNHVTPDEFDTAVPLVPEQVIEAHRQPNKAKLNELAKRGGEIRRIVEQACYPVSTNVKTEVTRKGK